MADAIRPLADLVTDIATLARDGIPAALEAELITEPELEP